MEQAQQTLKEVAQAGDFEGLYESINRFPDILDYIDNKSFVETPLHTAASAGHTRFALEIIRLKPSSGRKLNPDGFSALHMALQNGHSYTADRLTGFDKELLRVKGRNGFTPLHAVAQRDEIELLAEFLRANPESIEDLTIGDETAVHIAVKISRIRATKLLLRWISIIGKGHVLDWKDEEGNTVLHAAVSSLQNEIVKLLVQVRGMNKNEKNLVGLTALDIALRQGNDKTSLEICMMLLKAGASESTSLVRSCSLSEFLMSPLKPSELIFGIMLQPQIEITKKVSEMVVVVAVLIATATFQAVLQPPGGVLNNSTTSTTMNINDTRDPLKPVLIKSPDGSKVITYGIFFFSFYCLNTLAFIGSILAIMSTLQLRAYNIHLHLSLGYLMVSYGIAFFAISPSLWIACFYMSLTFLYVVSGWALLVQLQKFYGQLRSRVYNTGSVNHQRLLMLYILLKS